MKNKVSYTEQIEKINLRLNLNNINDRIKK